MRINLTVTEDPGYALTLATEDGIAIGANEYIPESTFPAYTGAVTVTPGAEAQVLSTRNTVLLSDITVEAIPSNYGLITWNGSVLTVS